MKAVGVHNSLPVTDQNALQDVTVPQPEALGHDLLVRVKAVSVNPVDTKIRMTVGSNAAQPRVLGWDCAGVVEAVGDKCTRFQPGDAVFYAGDVTRPGCNSELHLVDERIVGHKPASLDFLQSAAMPLTSITAWEAMFDRMNIARDPAHNRGRRILIIGGAGGVGSIAIQLARQVAGLEVIATASRDDTAEWCRRMGADHVINHREDMLAQLKQAGISGVDYIFCTVGTAQHWQAMADIINPQGRICLIVDPEGGQAVNLSLFKPKSAVIAWEFMFTRPRFQTPDIAEQGRLLDAVAKLLDQGVLHHTMTVDAGPLTASSLRDSHARLESGTMIGKLVHSL